jgi:hypothetical protein
MPGHRLGVVDVVFSAQTLAWMVRHFDKAPPVLNLFEPELPTKQQLLAHLRRANPDLTVVWLPPVILHPLSWVALALQKVLRPRSSAINVAKVFARLRYDTSGITRLDREIHSAPVRTPTSQPAFMRNGVRVPADFPASKSHDRQPA